MSLRVVVDANIVAAALIRPEGWTARELDRADVEWFAPHFLVEELDEHAAEYSAKAECGRPEWARRVKRLMRRLTIVGTEDVLTAARHPLARRADAADPDDAPYVATLVAAGADLVWTRDKALLAALPGIAVTMVPRREA